MENRTVDDQLFEVAVGPHPTRRPLLRDGQDIPPLRPVPVLPPAPSLDDWLPEDHEARFISEAVEISSTCR